MSEENLNNSSNDDETMALFVSAQKKKKQEEEAKKKAAEEQERREAAEAEVRRMELEVEERRRKAEEERIALENEEKAREKNRAKMAEQQSAKTEKAENDKAAGGSFIDKLKQLFASNPKMKLYAGIGAGVLVLAVVLIIILCSGSSKINVNELVFSEKYETQNSKYDIGLVYPKDTFESVTEKIVSIGDGLEEMIVHFDGNKSVNMDMMIVPTYAATSFISCGDTASFVDSLTKMSDVILKDSYPGAVKGEEHPINYTDGSSDRYVYSVAFDTADGEKGYCVLWYLWDKSDVVDIVAVVGTGKADSFETTEKLCTRFFGENSKKIMMLPGYAPATKLTLDEPITLFDSFPILNVPSEFYEIQTNSNGTMGYGIWADKNGSIIICKLTDGGYLSNLSDEEVDALDQNVGARFVYSSLIEDRKVIAERVVNEEPVIFSQECKLKLGGVPYYEKYLIVFVEGYNSSSEKITYEVEYSILTPQKNSDEYLKIPDRVAEGYLSQTIGAVDD